MGYPVMLELLPEAGGGMRDVGKRRPRKKPLDSAMQEAGAAPLGNDAMYMEKLNVDPRHIEIQDRATNMVRLTPIRARLLYPAPLRS